MNRSIILISFCDGPFEGFSDHSAIILYVLNKIIRMDVKMWNTKSGKSEMYTKIDWTFSDSFRFFSNWIRYDENSVLDERDRRFRKYCLLTQLN